MKKRIKSPNRSAAANLVGGKRARMMREDDLSELVRAVRLKKGTFEVKR